MNIELHMIMWNEEKLLPLVLKYYKQFCTRIICYDNYSTDRSVQIALDNGAEVRTFGIKGVLDDDAYLEVKNHCWKGSTADYVIVCDADEVLWQENIEYVLEKELQRGTTMFRTSGWSIYQDQWPMFEITESKRGVYDEGYSKSIIFDPKVYADINYTPGAHRCSPVVVEGAKHSISQFWLYVLHYRKLGGLNMYLRRIKEYNKRLSFKNKKKGWGRHYMWSESKIAIDYMEKFNAADSHLHIPEQESFLVQAKNK